MYKRHTFLTISRQGRERILKETLEKGFEEQYCKSLLLPEEFKPCVERYEWCQQFTPAVGIVRREEDSLPHGFIPVGFSSWKRMNNQKVRIANFVAPQEIVSVSSPYDVLNIMRADPAKFERNKALCALAELISLQNSNDFALGVWGSAAQELMTGYFYTCDDSDLDVIMTMSFKESNSIELLLKWLEIVTQVENKFGVRIDVELELPNGYGVSLKEFFGEGLTMLGKSLTDVALLSKNNVFAELEQAHYGESSYSTNVNAVTI